MRIQLHNPTAIAKLQGEGNTNRLCGAVRFYQQPGGVIVETRVFGLPNSGRGRYALRIHEGAACSSAVFTAVDKCSDQDCAPRFQGAEDPFPLISCGGRGYLAFMTDSFSIKDVLGRTVVIHSLLDDSLQLSSAKTDDRVAHGVILPRCNKR